MKTKVKPSDPFCQPAAKGSPPWWLRKASAQELAKHQRLTKDLSTKETLNALEESFRRAVSRPGKTTLSRRKKVKGSKDSKSSTRGQPIREPRELVLRPSREFDPCD